MGRMEVQGQPEQIVYKTPLISKITRAKWTGGAVEFLLYKLKAMSSNPDLTKRERERE
jgi:hypothetical protein